MELMRVGKVESMVELTAVMLVGLKENQLVCLWADLSAWKSAGNWE